MDRVVPGGTLAGIEVGMNTASESRRASYGRSNMASVETEWPMLQLGAVGEAWRLYKRHWGIWSLAALISLACYGMVQSAFASLFHVSLPDMFEGLIGVRAPRASFFAIVLAWGIFGFFLGGMARMAINQVRGRPPRIEDLFSVTDVWFDLVLGSMLLAAVVNVGLHLFVLPGLVAAGLLLFTFPLVVDGKLPATGAMIQSFHALKAQWLLAAAVHVVLCLLLFLGGLFCGIGLLITGPLYPLTIAVLYRDVFLNPYSPAWSKPKDEHDEL
jgi:hypothetical protein